MGIAPDKDLISRTLITFSPEITHPNEGLVWCHVQLYFHRYLVNCTQLVVKRTIDEHKTTPKLHKIQVFRSLVMIKLYFQQNCGQCWTKCTKSRTITNYNEVHHLWTPLKCYMMSKSLYATE